MWSDSSVYLMFILFATHPKEHAALSASTSVVSENDATGVNTSIPCTDATTSIDIPPKVTPYAPVHQDNSTLFTVADVPNNYCSARCRGVVLYLLESPERCSDAHVRCYPCDCKKPHCEVYGTCCPDMTSVEELQFSQEIVSERQLSTASYKTVVRETSNKKQYSRSSNINIWQEIPGKRQFPRTSKQTQVGCDDHSVSDVSFLYIRSCPVDFIDQRVRKLCEEHLPDHEKTMKTFARVSDNKTGLVYYNKYCAECMAVLEPTAWNMSVKCLNYLRVYSATNKEELLRLSHHADSLCTVHQEHPPGLVLHSCQSAWYDEVFGSCNETGQWSASDKDIATKCEKSNEVASTVRVSYDNNNSQYYKNIFCAICNSDSDFLYRYTCSLKYGSQGCSGGASSYWDSTTYAFRIDKRTLPFSLLLGSPGSRHTQQPESGIQFKNCPVSEWPSIDGTCLLLQCTPGKYLDDGKCTTAITDITGLGYRVSMLYLPSGLAKDIQPNCHLSQRNCSEILGLLMTYLQEQKIFSPAVAETEIAISYVWKESNSRKMSSENVQTVFDDVTHNTRLSFLDNSQFFFYVEAYFIANNSIPRDEFENTVLTSFLLNVPEIQMEENLTIHLVPKLIPEVPDLSVDSYHISKNKSEIVSAKTAVMCNHNNCSSLIWTYKHEFIYSSGGLTCIHVSFNKSQYTISVNCTIFPPTWHISLNLGQIKLIFSDFFEMNRLFIETHNGSSSEHMNVCVDLLEEKIQELKTNHYRFENSGVNLWLYYLTHVCICMSLFTLLMTLIVYLLFASLRNEAGTNNMFLCGTLLLAQAALLASSHVESLGLVCMILGISTHFLWLSMITWSIICCFHMFRVFTAKTGILKTTTSSQRNNRIKKAVIGILAPASIVASVMISTYFTSGGERIGYTESNPCYLESSLLAIISLATPLGVVTIANIYFFACTVKKIHNVKKLQTHTGFKKNESQTFIIYIKLSSLTGAFWAIAIISEHTNNDPLRFIAIILNGLQGVFLFLSFVCTKRVSRLCFEVLHPEKCSPTTISKSTGPSKRKTVDKSSAF